MSSCSACSSSTSQASWAKIAASKPAGSIIQPKDADGDNDGDTAAIDSKGLDVRG
jgi:hypothetical protein